MNTLSANFSHSDSTWCEKKHSWWQSWQPLLEHFPKSIFCMLYTIWKLRKSRIQRFKPCMIWSWNEEDMAFGRQLHHVKWPISQGEFHIAKISQGDFLHGAKFCHFAPWRNTLRKFRKVDLGTLRNLDLSSSPLAKCLRNPLFWDAVDDIPLPVLQDILLDF